MTRAYIDPDLRPVLDAVPPLEFTAETLTGIRAAMADMFAQAQAPTPAAPAVVEAFEVPGPDGAPPVRVVSYRPARDDAVRPAILHIHGGGFVLGSPEMADAANRRLAAELQCRIVSVDYRLAPETSFPGAVEDCYAALQWLHAQAGVLRVDPQRIGVKGESAGGGLAAALALLARDRGGPAIAFQHLTYPMLDDRTVIDPHPNPFTGEYMWTRAYNRFGWSSLVGTGVGGEGVSPYAAPARATDLAGLPPAFLAVGGLDLFLDENLAYAHRLAQAGVPVELHLYPGAFHGFEMAAEARVTLEAGRIGDAALRRSLEAGKGEA